MSHTLSRERNRFDTMAMLEERTVAPVTPEQPAQLSNVDLGSRALLAHLRVRSWGKSKKDDTLTDEITNSHKTDDGALRVTKALSGTNNKAAKAADPALAAFEEIYTIGRDARAFHYHNTRAWLDNGARILSADNLEAYSKAMDEFEDKFERAVRALVPLWPQFVQSSIARLKTAATPADYPRQDEIASYYSLGVNYGTMPTAADFRADVSQVQVERIKRQMEAVLADAMAVSLRTEMSGVVEVIAKMAKSLRKYTVTPQGVEHNFHKTLVTNVGDLVDHLGKINITDDPALAAIASDIEASLTVYSAQSLKDSEHKRAQVAAEADRILANVSAFIS